MDALDPTVIAECAARLASPEPAGEAYWRRAARALLDERAVALALLGDARWLVAEATYLACGVNDEVHARAVHLADRVACFLDAPPPSPAELEAALAAQRARVSRA
jgi:hypothetical protein